MINAFLSGKKKYSIPILALLVMLGYALTGQEPPSEVAQWAAAALGGLYLLVEGAIDFIREWRSKQTSATPALPQAAPAPVAARTAPVAMPPSPSSTQAAQKPSAEEITATAPSPVDWARFQEEVLARAKQDYGDVDPGRPNLMARFYATRAAGAATPCPSLVAALTYADIYAEAAEAAFKYLWGFPLAEAASHLADDDPECPYTSVDSMARRQGEGYYAILREVRRAYRKTRDLEALQELGVPDGAIKKLADRSLYGVMELAYQLLPPGGGEQP